MSTSIHAENIVLHVHVPATVNNSDKAL